MKNSHIFPIVNYRKVEISKKCEKVKFQKVKSEKVNEIRVVRYMKVES